MRKTVLVMIEGRILVGELIRSKGLVEWRHWSHMWRRCIEPKASGYARYGGAGITVHDSWKEFAQFYADLGPRPTPQYSLDRYPNNAGNYEPGNVRWATPTEQNLNRKNAAFVEFEGKRQRLYDLALRFGMPLNSVAGRIRFGWTVEEALTIPINPHAKPHGKNLRLTLKRERTTP